MRISFISKTPMVAFGLFFALGLITSAQAETDAAARFSDRIAGATDYIERICEKDVLKYCSTVTPGEGRLIMCALAHADKLSNACGGALFDAVLDLGDIISNAQIAASVCEADIEKSCGNVELGEGRVAQCLIDNKTEISNSCAEEVEAFEANN